MLGVNGLWRKGMLPAAALVMVTAGWSGPAWGWGPTGHQLINRLAAANLPPEVPEFLRDARAQEAMAYYGPEPDRWRSSLEPELNAEQAPEHFIDLEYADVLGELPKRRYDYVRALGVAQGSHPDLPLSVEKVGLQPYAANEVWERLKAGLRAYRQLTATKADTRPVECEIVFYAGWLGHFVGDAANPLHTTIQYNGWTGPNPKGYTTEHTIHAQFESVFVDAAMKPAEVGAEVAAAKPKLVDDEWTQYLGYLRQTNGLVEQTYVLEKAGGFAGMGTPAGKAFMEQQLAAGAIELRDLIYTAWMRSADAEPERKS